MGESGQSLDDSQLKALKPIRSEGGQSLRAYCPFHGSDRQRSLRVDLKTGRFQCFACGIWGYMDWAREEYWKAKQQVGRPRQFPSLPRTEKDFEPRPDLEELLQRYQAALPGSVGEEYLWDRGIPLQLAQLHGVGYAAAGEWAHRSEDGKSLRDWKWGRVVFPHTRPDGRLVNLYGRAIGDLAGKGLRHDHLPGQKGYFGGKYLNEARQVYVCEGPFDALSLLAAWQRQGENAGRAAIAIFGVHGWRTEWFRGVEEVVFGLDADQTGQQAWRKLARELVLAGKRVRYLTEASYGGAKDLNEAWVGGVLQLD